MGGMRAVRQDLFAVALTAFLVPATTWWMLAGCQKKSSGGCGKKTAAAAPAAPAATALAAEQDAVHAATAAPAGRPAAGKPGTHTIGNLERVLSLGTCEGVGKLDETLAQMGDGDHRDATREAVSERDTVRESALTEWLVLAHRYQTTCDARGPDGRNAADWLPESPPMSETTIELALKHERCAFLSAVDGADAWPFPTRFAAEVQSSDYQGAEVTRVLWLESLRGYLTTCNGKMSARERVTAETRVRKLDRIIGLDDEVLIDLRSKMVAALQAGNAQTVLQLSQAVNEREKAIDSRNAVDYDAKLASIEAMVQQQMADASAAKKAAAQPAATPGSNGVKKSADAAATAANIAKTADSAVKAAKATKSMLKLFGM